MGKKPGRGIGTSPCRHGGVLICGWLARTRHPGILRHGLQLADYGRCATYPECGPHPAARQRPRRRISDCGGGGGPACCPSYCRPACTQVCRPPVCMRPRHDTAAPARQLHNRTPLDRRTRYPPIRPSRGGIFTPGTPRQPATQNPVGTPLFGTPASTNAPNKRIFNFSDPEPPVPISRRLQPI